jgi:hypothetical protein
VNADNPAASHRAVGKRRETHFDEQPGHAMAQLAAAEEDGPIILQLRLPPKPAHLVLPARQDRGELIRQSGYFVRARSAWARYAAPSRSPGTTTTGVAPTGLRLRGKGPGAVTGPSPILASSLGPAQVGFACRGRRPCSSASRTMAGVGHHRSNPRSAHTAAAAW